MSSCRTIRTDSRIRSTPSPARNASSNSDTADWDNAIGGLLFSVCLAVHTEDPADGPQPQQATPQITSKPTTPRDSYVARGRSGLSRAVQCLQPAPVEGWVTPGRLGRVRRERACDVH